MAGTPWNKVALAALAVLAAVAMLVVVTDPARKPVPPPERVPTPDLVAAVPDWTRPGSLAATPGSPGIRDGAALIQWNGGLTLADLATGKPRWTQAAATPLAGSAEVYAGGGILIGDGVLVRTRTGIALLSSADGTVAWQTPVRVGIGERHVLVAADDRAALVVVGSTRGEAPRVIAFDAGTGQRRWERGGLWPYGIVGHVVVGEDTSRRAVAALDLATGAPAWTVAGFDSARVGLTAGDAVLVEGSVGGRLVRRVVAASTGEELARLGSNARSGPCATDGAKLVACVWHRGRRDLVLETFAVRGRSVHALTGDYQAHDVCLVGPEHIFAASARSYFATDRGGRVVARTLPGRPVAVNGDHLVLLDATGRPPSTSVYRLRK
jgi:hypothetical protein